MEHSPPIPTRQPKPAADTALMASDTDVTNSMYEDRLITLLGQLEHFRTVFEETRVDKRSDRMLDCARGIIEAVTEFADLELNVEFVVVRSAEEHVREFHERLKSLAQENGRSSWRSFINLGGRPVIDPAVEAIRNTTIRDCLASMEAAVSQYFVLFTERFSSSRNARGWVEAAAGFLVELRRDVREAVPPTPSALSA